MSEELRTDNFCPDCSRKGVNVRGHKFDWDPPIGLDPRMEKYQCSFCNLYYFVVPQGTLPVRYRPVRVLQNG